MHNDASRREAAFFMPGRESFSLWARFGVVLALACLVILVQRPAHATEHRRGYASHHRVVKVSRGAHHRKARVRSHRVTKAAHRHAHRAGRAVPVVNGRYDTVSIAMRYLGRGNPTGTRGPWCGDFMNFVEHLAGRPGIRSRMARDWARYGRAVGAVPGAIAVQRGHVAIVMRRVGARVQIISGNWSHRVGIGWISARSVIAFRKA